MMTGSGLDKVYVQFACDDNVTLRWTPPNSTGGLGVVIAHYVVSVTGPVGYTCPPEQCNVTTTNTTLTGLPCNTSYIVTVRAVNCRGEGTSSPPAEIFISESTLAYILKIIQK